MTSELREHIRARRSAMLRATVSLKGRSHDQVLNKSSWMPTLDYSAHSHVKGTDPVMYLGSSEW